MDWSYIACFIDTDGYIRVYKQHNKSGFSFHVSITFYNNNLEVLQKIQQFTERGGVIYKREPRKSNQFQRKINYALRYGRIKDTLFILEHIVDKMYIKKRKALMGLEILRSKKPNQRKRKKINSEEFKELLKRLPNKKCRRCGCTLNDKNVFPSYLKYGNYLCKKCTKEYRHGFYKKEEF